MNRLAVCACAVALLLAVPDLARAEEGSSQANFSSERFALLLGLGAYQPTRNDGGAFDQTFGGDQGPMLRLGLDYYAYRIPYVGPIGLGVHTGWARYKGTACDNSVPPICNGSTGITEKLKLNIFPVAALALLRIDVLARHTPVPLIFTGRIGVDSVFFISKKGSTKDGKGRTHGLRWGLEAAIELNSISPRRAASLDDEFGINSSFLFVEIFSSDADSKIPLGDKLAWVIGLGLTL